MTSTPDSSNPTSSTAPSSTPAIIPVAPEADEPTQGVVFWWSNILRGYQLRFYPPEPLATLPELARMPQIYLSRAAVENDAFTLARQFGVAIYEIQIPHLSPPANESDG